MKLIFYTSGDTRPAPPVSARLTLSALYLAYARAISARGDEILSVARDTDAQTAIDERTARGASYEKIVFVGHGLPGAYFFSGLPEGRDNFIAADMSYLFDANDTSLIVSLGRALNDRAIPAGDWRASPSIEFHSCYTGSLTARDGSAGLLPTIQHHLNGVRASGHLAQVLGFQNYFRWSPEVNPSGQIVGWHNAVVDPRTHRMITSLQQPPHGTLTPPFETILQVARVARGR